MDRYYNILGIPSNSSKETIKKAYRDKMKALHPDKIHGTPLEETAAFFTAEINDAYNILMSQFKHKNTSSNEENQENFIEEEIFIENHGLLKYTISNDINIILNAIVRHTGLSIPHNINEIPWQINPILSENVKHSMNKHNMNYSMTECYLNSKKVIIINKRMENKWYTVLYENDTYTGTTKKNNAYRNKDHSAYTSILNKIIKITFAIMIFYIIFQQFNNTQPTGYKASAQTNRTTQIFATVTSCDWLYVRSTPSAVSKNNIIEAISQNTRVEILDRNNNGWVNIKYNNGKTGYVYGDYLSQ